MVLKVLVLLVVLATSSCNYWYSREKFDNQDIWSVEKNDLPNCIVGAEQLRDVFNFEGVDLGTYRPEEDPDLILIKHLRSCPTEETAKSLANLRDNGQNDLATRAKATYLLVKIGAQVPENAAALLELYKQHWKEKTNRYKEKDYEEKSRKKLYDDSYDAGNLLSLIGNVLDEDYHDNEYLAKTLELETDGAYSEMMSGLCASEFGKAPENFLRIVKLMPKKKREDVFMFTAYAMRRDKMLEQIARIPTSSDVYPLTKELLKASDKIAGK